MKKALGFLICCAFLFQESFGSSCCGSSISMPALITTGENWKFQTAFSQSERIFQVTDEDVIKLSQENQLGIFKTQIKSGYRFANNWQIFGQASQYNQGTGDFDLGIGREIPMSEEFKTFLWAQLTMPTGKSIYEMKNPDDTPTGNGFWTPGLGLSLSRDQGAWDYSGSLYLAKGFQRNFNGVRVTPGWQSYAQVALGRSSGNWRTGFAIEYQREEGKKISLGTKASDSFSWPLTFSVSYLNQGDIWTVSYSDETLLGPAKNTFLNRGLSLSYVKRFF